MKWLAVCDSETREVRPLNDWDEFGEFLRACVEFDRKVDDVLTAQIWAGFVMGAQPVAEKEGFEPSFPENNGGKPQC